MRRFRNGRFVETPKGIGIIFNMSAMPLLEIHLIDKQGETVNEIKLHVDQVKVLDKPLPSRKAKVKQAALKQEK